jgi:hypothetical protein
MKRGAVDRRFGRVPAALGWLLSDGDVADNAFALA